MVGILSGYLFCVPNAFDPIMVFVPLVILGKGSLGVHRVFYWLARPPRASLEQGVVRFEALTRLPIARFTVKRCGMRFIGSK